MGVSSSHVCPGKRSCRHLSSPVLCHVGAGTGRGARWEHFPLTCCFSCPPWTRVPSGGRPAHTCRTVLVHPPEGPSRDRFPPPRAFPREPKDREQSPQSAARTLPRRRKGFCECCQEAFEELHAVSPPCPAASLGLLCQHPSPPSPCLHPLVQPCSSHPTPV